MKNFILSIALFTLLGMAGCASVPQHPSNTYFSFDFEDSTYEIIGIADEEKGSANFLLHRQNDTILFRVIDLNQDGNIDRVVTGPIGLGRANLIYKEGIRQAIEKNQFRETPRLREFDMAHNSYQLHVQSIVMGRGLSNNRFTIYNCQNIILGVYIDEGSDGNLNTRELGEVTLDDAQNLYDVILLRASEKNRIETAHGGQYIITYRQPARASAL